MAISNNISTMLLILNQEFFKTPAMCSVNAKGLFGGDLCTALDILICTVHFKWLAALAPWRRA